MKKPPDIYKTYKNSFLKIIKDDYLEGRINDAMERTNKITTRTYLVLRLYLLKCFNNENIFNQSNKLNESKLDGIIRDIHTIICKKGQGKRRNVSKDFIDFYENEYLSLQNNKDLLDKVNLNQILNYEIERMITCYKNSIVSNFFNYLFRFINTLFDYQELEDFKQLKNKEEIKNFKKNHFAELKKVKNDLLNNTLKCDIKYHSFIQENRYKIVPKEINKSIHYDLKENPLKYLEFFVFMSKYLEDRNKKLFQVFPIRKNIILKHIDIDTKSIIELSNLTDKNIYLSSIKEYQDELWNTYFCEIKDKKNYKFNNRIMTDGVSCSICYIDKTHYGKKNVKKEKQKEEYIEFPYIDEVDFDKLKNSYENENYVFVDPGKNNLLYMMDKDNNFIKYTNKQRIRETERLKIQNQIQKIKEKKEIDKIENELSNYNSKTCDYNKFKEFVKKKEEINEKVFIFYKELFLRRMKRRAYINTQRSESKLVNNIKTKFGDNPKFIYGNYNITKQQRNFISTPCIGLKRMLNKHFEILNLDEFRTSCLSYIKEEKVKNLKINRREIHPVLMLTQKNNGLGCISRDKNAVLNFKKIFDYYLETKGRPQRFCRGFDIDNSAPIIVGT